MQINCQKTFLFCSLDTVVTKLLPSAYLLLNMYSKTDCKTHGLNILKKNEHDMLISEH